MPTVGQIGTEQSDRRRSNFIDSYALTSCDRRPLTTIDITSTVKGAILHIVCYKGIQSQWMMDTLHVVDVYLQ
jgi:hypothetical protein